MDKAKKKNIKRIISLVCVVAVVAVLAAMPLIAKPKAEETGPKASILSGKAELGSLREALIGGGTLTQESGEVISIPAAVKLKSFLVSNGDVVTEGTAIATVDRVTVMTAITQVQETLEYLSEEINTAEDNDDEDQLTALAGGTVKKLYAKAGDSVRDVMLQYGALAVLSLDGLMAVDFDTDASLPSGTEVTVTLSDGTAVSGKVNKNLAGAMTVTLEDDGYPIGEAVSVTDADGAAVGSGELYVYSPWNATAYAGTVKEVKISEGDETDPGDTLLVLENVGSSASYLQLIQQRQTYEDLMLKLFKMYQTETVVAECDGVISGVDENSLQLLSGNGEGYTLTFLNNSPSGEQGATYANHVAQIVMKADNGWVMKVNPQPEVPDTPATPDTPERPGGSDKPTEPSDPDADQPTDPSNPDVNKPSGGQTGNNPQGGTGNFPQNGTGSFPGGSGSYPQGGMTFPEAEPEYELYGMDMSTIAAVIPQDTMTLEITVDEQDVAALAVGMDAQVRIDALGGEKHDATITLIGNTGTNNGGSSKFTVTLTLNRGGNMLNGMTATVTVMLSETEQVLTLPAAALVEDGTRTLIYTGYNEKENLLLNPVEVTVGLSDGKNVQILEGLTQGQTYYYAYYDTLETSVTPDFGNSGLFGR